MSLPQEQSIDVFAGSMRPALCRAQTLLGRSRAYIGPFNAPTPRIPIPARRSAAPMASKGGGAGLFKRLTNPQNVPIHKQWSEPAGLHSPWGGA